MDTPGRAWSDVESDLSMRMWLIRLAEGVLVSEQMTASWVVEYWVKIILHHNLFHYSGQDGVTGVTDIGLYSAHAFDFATFGTGCNYTSFPLTRNLRSCE